MAIEERREIMYFVSPSPSPSPIYEFDEADIWNAADVYPSPSPDREFYQLATIPGELKKKSMASSSSSLPMKIPQDWSKIPGVVDYEEMVWLPPHVFLARQRATVGRLVGREVSIRVRDAIWKHTGFED